VPSPLASHCLKCYLPMVNDYHVIVIGGGLAGLTAALALAGKGFDVMLLEKHPYPRHKVCGEYLSREVQPYLQSLGLPLSEAVVINRMQLTTINGRSLQTSLPLGGLGISRYALDASLYNKAKAAGVAFKFETVTGLTSHKSGYTVTTSGPGEYRAALVVGAYGKRAALDKELGRGFIEKPSPWLAVKAHYSIAHWPDELVGLFTFRGGYAGLSKTETGALNFCYLASYSSFRQAGTIEAYNEQVVSRNPYLREFLGTAKMIFEKPLSIAQISFGPKQAAGNGMLMCGDTAGMIHPLCGNGMAMAIQSARIASELITQYLNQQSSDRKTLLTAYSRNWQQAFGRRLSTGRRLQALLLNESLSELAVSSVARSPWLMRKIISATHGKPFGA